MVKYLGPKRRVLNRIVTMRQLKNSKTTLLVMAKECFLTTSYKCIHLPSSLYTYAPLPYHLCISSILSVIFNSFSNIAY